MISDNIQQREADMSSFFYSYLITDPKYYGNTAFTLQNSLEKSFSKHKIDIVCFRDKETKDIEDLAKISLQTSKRYNIGKTLINGNIELAVKFGFDGVHLTSQQFDQIKTAKRNGLFTIISCHSFEDLREAKLSGADGATYSPIFYKEQKGKPKGCEKLKEAVENFQDKDFIIIGLGGIITNKEIVKVKETNAKGFASIRYFKVDY